MILCIRMFSSIIHFFSSHHTHPFGNNCCRKKPFNLRAFKVGISGESTGGARGTRSPYLWVWMIAPRSPFPYLKVWICHWPLMTIPMSRCLQALGLYIFVRGFRRAYTRGGGWGGGGERSSSATQNAFCIYWLI